MGLADILKGFLTSKLKNLNINLLSNNKIIVNKIHLSNKTETIYDEGTKTAEIGVNGLTGAELKTLLGALPKQLEKYGTPILEEDFGQTYKGYQDSICKQENQKIIAFLKDKLPKEDMLILNASIYLRDVLSHGGKTEPIKMQIVNRYGPRGKNISNLFTAGYFESWIIPLFDGYEQLSPEEKESVQEIYQLIVDEYPFAVFVNRGITEKALEKMIRDKISSIEEYGIKTLTIHGIGEENNSKIQKVVLKLQDILTKYNMTIEKVRKIISVSLSRQ
jgi:glycosyltransferase involved in cell wall biosynthesis